MARATLFAPAPIALAAPEIAGDWHGTVAGSTGDTTIVLHFTRGADWLRKRFVER